MGILMRDSVEVCVSTFVLGPWWVHLGTALVPKGAFASNTSLSVKTGQVGTGMWVLAETTRPLCQRGRTLRRKAM